MTDGPIEKKWFIDNANELASARAWLKKNVSDKFWRLELVGLEDGGSSAPARIAVRCMFTRAADADAFDEDFLHGLPIVPVPAAAPPETEGDTAFAEGARRILGASDPVSAGKLHFLGLEKVRAHFGEQWPKLALRAEALARRAIERRLSPRDVYRKTADLNFVVIFANLNDREADIKCALIAEEITRMLIGDEVGADMLSVKTAATEVDGPKMLRQLDEGSDIAQAIETEVEVARRRREQASADVPPDDAAPVDPLAGLQFMYRPIWDVKRSAVANFYLLAAKNLGGGRWRYGDSEIMGLAAVRRQFDELVVDRAIADLQALYRQNRRLLISFPIHFETVSTATRRVAILERWRTLPPPSRKLGVFEVVGAPDGIPQGRVAEIVNHFKADTCGVFLRMPLTTTSFRNLSDTGILAVGTEPGPFVGTEQRLMATLRDFVINADRARLNSYVRGLRTFSLTIGAIGAGFQFIDGDPVSSISDRPEEVYRFGLEDLYARRFKAEAG